MLKKLLLLPWLLGAGLAPAQPTPGPPAAAPLDELKLVYFGSSVPYGQGATNKYGYTSRYSTLLARRAAAGQGAPWATANISVGGNSTVQVLGRWERDLAPQRARYVVYALALGNEGIHTGGRPVLEQFKANMLRLIMMARAQGMVPVVTNSYTRNDYTPTDYAFIKELNLLLHAWAVPTVNLLGAIDDGHGHWATGYWDDALHPNDLGHAELAHALVPSLFDALRAGKALPRRQPTAGITLAKGRRASVPAIRFTPEALVHPFTQAISFRAAAPGQLLELKDSTTSGYLRIERRGMLTYASAKGGRLSSAARVADSKWHHLVLTHYYARGETLLYLDGTLVGSLPEKLLARQLTIGGNHAPRRVQFRNWLFYRAGMNQEEAQALAADSLLKSSLELYAPLDGRRAPTPDSLANLAQSTNTLACLGGPTPPSAAKAGGIACWLTTPDQKQLLQRQPGSLTFGPAAASGAVIEIDDSQRFQAMDGFGYCLTGGSAELLHAMSAPARATLLRELFGTAGNGIGVSYLRLSIGASDLDAQVFSYDDLPAGQTDPALARFSLAPDAPHLLPVLQEILAINPNVKLLGSPWSPPAWMKTNGETKGGSLKPEFYAAYAQYFVKYLQAMRAIGITLDAITVQNEPLHPGNNPSLLMPAAQQAEFVGQYLGPALQTARLKTKIICYDHNADKPEYPLAVLADATANPYVDGSAFHLYAGPIEALSAVHDAYPAKNIYFTEEWVGSQSDFAGNLGWHAKNLFIGAPRNWARTVLEWNLAADPQQNPHTPGGCTECLGALTLAPGNAVTRNVAYYLVAHSSKFVPPGSVRVASTSAPGLPSVAYRTPSGGHVLLVLNDQLAPQAFSLRYQGRAALATLPAGALATYVW